ncbi:MAG: hypothetical protein AAB840_01700 [Patescibacteria group bacterium]
MLEGKTIQNFVPSATGDTVTICTSDGEAYIIFWDEKFHQLLYGPIRIGILNEDRKLISAQHAN